MIIYVKTNQRKQHYRGDFTLEYIRSIGLVVKNGSDKPDPIELFQKMDSETDKEPYNDVIEINISDDADANGNYVSIDTKDFRRSVLKEGLFYVKGRTYIGAALRQSQYVSDKAKEKRNEDKKKQEELNEANPINPKKHKSEPKPSSNISKCLQFLEISMDRLAEVSLKLDAKLAEKTEEKPGYKYIILFTRNGRKPFELDSCRDKFFDTYKTLVLHTVKDKPGYCHMCNNLTSSRYDTCGLGCYTNDKAVYNKTYGGTCYSEANAEDDRTLSFSVCDDCLIDLLYGERFVSKYLTVWWGGSKDTKVVFLPRYFDNDIKRTFETNLIGDTESDTGLLSRIQTNETDVLGSINGSNYSMDIMFISAPPGRSEWKIQYTIENVEASRFSKIAELQQKYQTRGGKTSNGEERRIKNLLLKEVIYYLVGNFAEKKGFSAYDDIFSTNEARYYLDVILHGVKINRREFFAHAMNIQWHYYARGKEKESMMTIHRVYNFLVDCGCLQNGWQMPIYVGGKNMTAPYLTIDELFERNIERFSSDYRKSWFLLGSVYGSIRRDMKSSRSKRGGNFVTKLLENSYMIDRKFDMKDFNEIVRICWDYACMHNTEHYIKTRLSRAIDLIGTGVDAENISPDEKALYFVWGQTQYIGEEKEEDEGDKEGENPDDEIQDNETIDEEEDEEEI